MSADGSLRLDKYLWFARLARTRSKAARLCADGCVTLNGSLIRQTSHPVRVGDWIEVDYGSIARRLRVTGLGERRGNADSTRLLFDEPDPPQRASREAWEPLLADA